MTLFQRLVNRFGTPVGILPFSFAHVCEVSGVGQKESVFERIYQEHYWTTGESDSGLGSELMKTDSYRRRLLKFLDRKNVKTLFDAPCGDLLWMSRLIDASNVRYIGGDISETALDLARSRCPNADLRHFDICRDQFPDADAWHCRDALFHLSFEDIWAALRNGARANVRFALLTTHRARFLRNIDIETGSWRYLDLERAPFNLGPPTEYLADFSLGEFPRFVGVWPIAAIRAAVAQAGEPRQSS